jgi:hypothetical protein
MFHPSIKLLGVVQATDPLGFRFRFCQRGKEHARQNRDDGDDYEQFDQSEAELAPTA